MTREEAKELYSDEVLGLKHTVIDKIYNDFEKELNKAEREAYIAGWSESGEGWNAEYGADDEDVQEKMEEYLKEK